MSEPSAAAGFLLAGGKSSRMGQDKALLMLDGETLTERGIRKLRAVCEQVKIAGGAVELAQFAPLVPDETPECGPLGGIVAALEQSGHDWNLFLAVDMPFVPEFVLRQLIAASAEGGTVLLAEAAGRMQPLCGMYAKRALPALRQELVAGRLKVKDAVMTTSGFRTVTFQELDWFRNLNTPQEFQAAAW